MWFDALLTQAAGERRSLGPARDLLYRLPAPSSPCGRATADSHHDALLHLAGAKNMTSHRRQLIRSNGACGSVTHILPDLFLIWDKIISLCVDGEKMMKFVTWASSAISIRIGMCGADAAALTSAPITERWRRCAISGERVRAGPASNHQRAGLDVWTYKHQIKLKSRFQKLISICQKILKKNSRIHRHILCACKKFNGFFFFGLCKKDKKNASFNAI